MLDSNTFQHLNLNDPSTQSQTNTGQVDMFSQRMYTPYQMTGQYPTTQISSTPIHQYHFHPYNSNPRDCEFYLSFFSTFHTLAFCRSPLVAALAALFSPFAGYSFPRFARITNDRCQRNEEPIPHLPHSTNVTPPINLTNLSITPFPQPSLTPTSRKHPTRIPSKSRIPLPTPIRRYTPQFELFTKRQSTRARFGNG
jgi:hypothetical protein